MRLVPGGMYKYEPKMQNAAVATGNGTPLYTADAESGTYAVVALQVTGTFVGTVTFECTIDGANWVPLEMKSIGASVTVATSATAPGIWVATVLGLSQVRARVSAYTSGSVTVQGRLSANS